jgi:hypothetical protein
MAGQALVLVMETVQGEGAVTVAGAVTAVTIALAVNGAGIMAQAVVLASMVQEAVVLASTVKAAVVQALTAKVLASMEPRVPMLAEVAASTLDGKISSLARPVVLRATHVTRDMANTPILILEVISDNSIEV